MINIGAYDYGVYKKKMDGRDDPRLGAAILAIKHELIYNGYSKKINDDLQFFGDAMRNRVKEFQADQGLFPDGECGSKTLTELFRKRVISVEKEYELPRGALGKKLKLESGYDPVAIGWVDQEDTGIAQINIGIHSSVSQMEAFDPAFAIDWAGRYVKNQFDSIADQIDVMKAARAAYNIGNFYAIKWLLAGFPESGGPLLGGEDVFKRATRYVSLIDGQNW